MKTLNYTIVSDMRGLINSNFSLIINSFNVSDINLHGKIEIQISIPISILDLNLLHTSLCIYSTKNTFLVILKGLAEYIYSS